MRTAPEFSGAAPEIKREFGSDSSLEGTGFEPLVPPRKRRPSREAPRPTIVVSRDYLCLMTPSSLSVRHLSSAGKSSISGQPAPHACIDRRDRQSWNRWFADSPLEEAGFEPSVPLRWCCRSRPLRSTSFGRINLNRHLIGCIHGNGKYLLTKERTTPPLN